MQATSLWKLALATASQGLAPACVKTMWTVDDPFLVAPCAGLASWCDSVITLGPSR